MRCRWGMRRGDEECGSTSYVETSVFVVCVLSSVFICSSRIVFSCFPVESVQEIRPLRLEPAMMAAAALGDVQI